MLTRRMEWTFKVGARVGWWGASWPLAKLRIGAEVLEISVPFAGTHRFRPEDVIRIEKRGLAIQVEHAREDVAELVVFFSPRRRRILDAIEESGFRPSASEADKPVERPFPFRPTFLAVATLLWLGLILVDVSSGRFAGEAFVWGPGMFIALGLLFAGSVLIRHWGALQRFALTSPEALSRIEPARKFVVFVSGALFLAGGLAALASQ
jgi:hypothetical protein